MMNAKGENTLDSAEKTLHLNRFAVTSAIVCI